jgi:hypothetical protein
MRFVILFCCAAMISCQEISEKPDKLLASVYNRHLYLSELEGMIPPGSAREDSLLIIESYIQRWVRDALLMREAEQNVPNDLNINKLVKIYKESLILTQYEEKLADNLLDKSVDQDRLMKYYEETKSNYHLENTILKCLMIKVPENVENLDKLRSLWNEGTDLESLSEYCMQFAEQYLLDTAKWYDMDDVAAMLPPGTITKQTHSSRNSQTITTDEHIYFLKIIESRSTKEIAPIEYIQDQLKRLIIHQRKLRLLEDIKEDLYNRELGRNNVKIYLQ